MTNTNICLFCEKFVKTRDNAIYCDLCSKWIHIKCSNLNGLDYEYLKRNNETWYCETCIYEILPFCNKKIKPDKINIDKFGIGPNLTNLLCQLNNLSEKENNDNENMTNCKYRDKSYFSNPYVKLLMSVYRIMSSNKPQLNQLQEGLCYILIRNILIKFVLTLPFTSPKSLNQFWLKLFYPRCMDICIFNDHYLNPLLHNPSNPIKPLFS